MGTGVPPVPSRFGSAPRRQSACWIPNEHRAFAAQAGQFEDDYGGEGNRLFKNLWLSDLEVASLFLRVALFLIRRGSGYVT